MYGYPGCHVGSYGFFSCFDALLNYLNFWLFMSETLTHIIEFQVLSALGRSTNLDLFSLTRSNPRLRRCITYAFTEWAKLAAQEEVPTTKRMHTSNTGSKTRSASQENSLYGKKALSDRLAKQIRAPAFNPKGSVSRERLGTFD